MQKRSALPFIEESESEWQRLSCRPNFAIAILVELDVEFLVFIAIECSLYLVLWAVKLLTGPSLALFKVINWSKSKLLTGPRSFSHNKNRGFRRFVLLSYHCVFFLCPIICQFSKNSLFQKKGAKIGFFNFLCFKFKFWNYLLGVCSNTIKIGVSANFGVFCCCKRRKRPKKKITGISGCGFFCPKMAVSWLKTVFQKMGCWNPYCYSVLGVRAFLAKLSKKGNFEHPPKERKKWLITESSFLVCLWLCFCFFSHFFLIIFSIFCFSFFWRV